MVDIVDCNNTDDCLCFTCIDDIFTVEAHYDEVFRIKAVCLVV